MYDVSKNVSNESCRFQLRRSVLSAPKFCTVGCFGVSCTVPSLKEIHLMFAAGVLGTNLIEFSSEVSEMNLKTGAQK
jgi:hypothetical protein